MDFNPAMNAQIGIDYIRIVHIGPVPQIASFKPLRTIIKRGHEIPLTAIVQNNGDTQVEMKSVLTLPEEVTWLERKVENTHRVLFRDIADTLYWRIKCDHEGDYDVSLVLFSDTATAEEKLTLSVTDEYWQPEEIFLSAWSPPYAWYPAPYDTKIFEDYFAANFNIVLWVRPEETLVDMVENYDKKYLLLVSNLVGGDLYLRAPGEVISPEITMDMLANLDGWVEQDKNNPQVIGYFICDEPHEQAFENIGKVVAYLRQKDPTRLSFVNIWPGSSDTEYKNYISALLDKTKLELFSYDRYVFFNDPADQNIFFNNLSVIREAAMKYDIPFCNIIQAIGTNGTSEPQLNWRIPNEAEHRWQVYASLAYGAKGIIWFHWHLDWGVTGSPASEQIMASISKTNAEINALSPILLELNIKSVYRSKNVPVGEAPLPADALIKSVSSNADLVIGFFKDKSDSDYVMLMNKNFKDSISATIALNGTLNDLKSFEINSSSWMAVDFDNTINGAVFKCDLMAAGGRLYKLDLATSVGIQLKKKLPHLFQLNQNYLNPFNANTKITYVLNQDGQVQLEIFDIKGNLVKTFHNNFQLAGTHAVMWNAENEVAQKVSSGLNVCRLSFEEILEQRKLLFIK